MPSDGPLFAQIERELRRRIASGELKTGDRVPSLAEMCAHFKVSAITVRRALRELVSAGLLRGEQGRGVFVAETPPPMPPSRTQIALVIPDAAEGPFFAPILHGLQAALGREHDLLVSESGLQPGLEAELIAGYVRRRIAGLIIVPTAGQPSEALARTIAVLADGPPVVLLDRDIPGLPADRVASDNVAVGRLATGHLLDLGHRRVACVWAHACRTYDDRRRGWEEAHRERGLTPDPELAVGGWEQIQHYETAGYVHALELLHLPQPPSAIFACGDALALGVLRACAKTGRRVPEDIAVVGNDDVPYAATCDPPLTTVRQDLAGMSLSAARLLCERLASPGQPWREQRLPVELVVRRSSGGQRSVR